ncbi:MAG: 5'-3' exoribonuclease [Syntrophomonadaceae bacterium]|nr:5'-3' exoribonuclease [Bacillota bacterium]
MATEAYVDLHLHTNFSDGTFSPKEVVERSIKCGLRAISITDHDNTDGIAPAISAARGSGLEIVPGVELSADGKNNQEMHILGYYIQWENNQLQDELRNLQDTRQLRAKKMLGRLGQLKINIPFREVEELAAGGVPGRLHIARLMLQHGYVSSTDEAFDRYIGNGKIAYIKKHRLSSQEAIELIRAVGGIPVLAHPHLLSNISSTVANLLVEGLMGIEAYCNCRCPGPSQQYLKLAKKHHLISTGGSDCHGLAKNEVLMGKTKTPYSTLKELKNALNSHRALQRSN